MPHRRSIALALTLAVTVLAGCTSSSRPGPHVALTTAGSSGSADSTGAATTASAPASTVASFAAPSSTISATATTAPWSKKVALSHAKTITRDANGALTALSKVSQNATVSQARTALHALASADEDAIHKLAAGAWPTSARPKVNGYIAALDTERRALLGLAGKSSISAMQAGATGLSAVLAQVQSGGTALVNALQD